MKKLLVAIAPLFLIALYAAFSAGPPMENSAFLTLYVTNGSTSVPTNFVAGCGIANSNMYASRITIIGKASPRVNNTSTCYIGTTSGNDTQPYAVASGAEVILRARDGSRINLKDWWVDVGTINDGLTIIFQ